MTTITLSRTPIAGIYEATSHPVSDGRGAFSRLFCVKDLAEAHGGRPIVQINRSLTRRAGAVRGLHCQRPPMAEGKWVRCVRGRAFDVGVDLRRGSPTFLAFHAVELDADRQNAVFLPEGIAHGFQALTEGCELLYLHTAPYSPDHEGGVRYDDTRLSIPWPAPVVDLSERDRNHPLLADDFEGLAC